MHFKLLSTRGNVKSSFLLLEKADKMLYYKMSPIFILQTGVYVRFLQ